MARTKPLTTVAVSYTTKAKLELLKIHPRQGFDEIIEDLLAQRQSLNTEGKAAKSKNAMGLDLSLVRASVKELAFSGSKEDYMSGNYPIPVSQESWAEQWMLGYPNKNLNPNVKTQ